MFSAATRRNELNAVAEEELRVWNCEYARYRLALAAFLVVASLQLVPLITYAQNLGQQPVRCTKLKHLFISQFFCSRAHD